MKNSEVTSLLGRMKILRIYNVEQGEDRVAEWKQRLWLLLSPNLECDLINKFTLFCVL